jgi:hypothetical protein
MAEITAVGVPRIIATGDVLVLRMPVEMRVFQIAGRRFQAIAYGSPEDAEAAIIQELVSLQNDGERGILMVYEYAPDKLVTHFYES